MKRCGYLGKGTLLAACYAATTVMVALGLERLGVGGEASAVVGGAAGLLSSMLLLWWFKRRQREKLARVGS